MPSLDEEYRPEVRGLLHAVSYVPLTALVPQLGPGIRPKLFAEFEKRTLDAVKEIIAEITETAPFGLRDRCAIQGELAIQEADVSLA